MARKKADSPRLIEIFAIIGNNIRRLRGIMTQKEIGKKAGVTRGTINAIENGQGCTLATLIKIADGLGISAANLFITDDQRKEVSFQHVLLMEKLKESLTVK
jgi:transcriptional regulator with XRE-family HTH domain